MLTRPCRSLVVLAAMLLAGCGSDESPGTDHLPSAPIEVLRDTNGVPHIYGETDRDAFYGAGYMMATDRLLQVDMARRRALGRWSEVLPDKLADDKLARLFNWRDLGRQAAAVTKQDNSREWRLMTAWVAGLNRRIEEVRSHKVPLPYGFGPKELDYLPEKWDPSDVLVVAKMTGFGNDESLEYELFMTIAERLFPDKFSKVELPRPARAVWTVPTEDLPPGLPQADWIPGGPASAGSAPHFDPSKLDPERVRRSLVWLHALDSLRTAGSNNWAIDGQHTDNGRPLLAGDPHLGFKFPGIFYALHINSADHGGTFNVAGFSFPGLPGVSIGQTDSLAWTPTTAFADVMDVWEVPSPDFNTIVVGGKTTTVTIREETIHVRGAGKPAGMGSDVTVDERDVPGIGVVLPKDIAPIPLATVGHELLLRWTGFADKYPFRLTDLDRARDIDEFDADIDEQHGLNFNMLAADAHGITYRVGVDVPDRDPRKGYKPWQVMDGTNADSLWTGAMLPREDLPHGRAEKRGWLGTANNDPFGFTADGRVDDDPFYYGAFFAPGWRAAREKDRIEALIGAGKVKVSDMQALQRDLHSNLADDLIPLLDQAWAAADTDPALAKYKGDADLGTLMTALDAWDRRMARTSSGAVIFNAFAHFAASSTLEDDLKVLYPAAMDLETVFVLKIAMLVLRGDYPQGDALLEQGKNAVLLDALSQTRDFIVQHFGSVDPAGYQYGDLHVTKWTDSLGAGLSYGENPTDGGESTVDVSPHQFLDNDKPAQRWPSTYGPIEHMVVSFDADGTPRMQFNFPLGNICDPSSPHFNDLLSDWVEGKYRTMPFRRVDVEAAEEARLVIQP